jgi:DUF1009 family protein
MALALFAGRGDLPKAVADSLHEMPLVFALDDTPPDAVEPALTFRLEHLGRLLGELRARGVTEICFTGAVRRPRIELAEIDAATLPLVPALQRAVQPGDDGALRAIMTVFEQAGFTVRGAHEIAPDLLPPDGVLGAVEPHGAIGIERLTARRVLSDMARIDEGQACVIRGEEILAREDARGTDAMLTDLAKPRATAMPPSDDPFNWIMDQVGEVLDDAADWLSGDAAEKARLKGAGGVLVKGPKPGQDRRADLPTIGPRTIDAAAAAGLRGVVLASAGVMVLHRAEVVRRADAAGLFVSVEPL